MTLSPLVPPSSDVDIREFLEAEGFAGDSLTRAREKLEAAGLTRPEKRRIVSSKLERARDVLRSQLIRVCHRKACRDVADVREHVLVSAAYCELCGGSPNRRAGALARQAMLAAGYRHLLVVGGSPSTQASLVKSLGSDVLEIRCIDGTQGTRCSNTVEADLDWADFMVVWATTPLPHKVSGPYTSRARGRLPWITVARRGVEALCDALVRSAHARSVRIRGTHAAASRIPDPVGTLGR